MLNSQHQDVIPVLYSFRRCPYAIRARLALAVAGLRPGLDLELREVNLRARPPELRQVSAKATVPVLVLPSKPGTSAVVIDQSLEIMLWALARRDPMRWLTLPQQPVAATAGTRAGQETVIAEATLAAAQAMAAAGGAAGTAASWAQRSAATAPGADTGPAAVGSDLVAGAERREGVMVDATAAGAAATLAQLPPAADAERGADTAERDGWTRIAALIAQNDGAFKHHLDRFRYPERFLSEQQRDDCQDAEASAAENGRSTAANPAQAGRDIPDRLAGDPATPPASLDGLPPWPLQPDPGDSAATAPGPAAPERGSLGGSRPDSIRPEACAGPAEGASSAEDRRGAAGGNSPPRHGKGSGIRPAPRQSQRLQASAAASRPTRSGGGSTAAAGPADTWRQHHRQAALRILHHWNARLQRTPWLLGNRPCLADIALFPFVRQFQLADPHGFQAETELAPLQRWLERLLAWPLLAEVMEVPWGPRSSWHSPRWLYHLALADEWRQAQADGVYRRSSRGLALEQVGFVHACQAHQLAATHQRFYADLPASAVRLLSIDPERLARHGVPIRYEPAAESGELFPHLYGALPLEAVLLAEPYRPADYPEGCAAGPSHR